MVTTHKSKPIPLAQAARMISNYLKEQDLSGLADRALGGTIPRESFWTFQAGYKGTQFWFCYNMLERNPLYLAAEQMQYDWDPNNVPTDPSHGTLHAPKPEDVFVYNGAGKEPNDVEVFLRGHSKAHNGTARMVRDVDVSQHSRTFRSSFGNNSKYYCEHPVGYFVAEGKDEAGKPERWFTNFLGTVPADVPFVRYYFGYENRTTREDDDKPNRIRIILVAVDQAGRNIIGITKGGDGTVLQKSFPPPPAP